MEPPAASLADLGSPGWIIGLVVLFLVVSLPAVAVPRLQPPAPPPLLWDIPRVAQIYTTVVGSFAGFAAASTVFVARLGFDRPTQAFEELIGLLALSFMMLATSAMQFGNTPNAVGFDDPQFVRVQRLSFLVSNVALTQGVITSWLSLVRLTAYSGLAGLSQALAVFMVLVVGIGLLRLTQYLHDCSTLPGVWCLVMPPIAIAGAVTHFFGFGGAAPHLLPPTGEPFHYAFACAIVVGSGFAWQSVMFTLYQHGYLSTTLAWRFEQLAAMHTIFAATILCLLALSTVAR